MDIAIDFHTLGQFPGPLVEVNSGDELVVNVFNQLPNGTSLHWHGQLQNGTNYMDGTTGITQCPIPPGMNFSKLAGLLHDLRVRV